MKLGRRKLRELELRFNSFLHQTKIPTGVYHDGEQVHFLKPCKEFWGARDNTGYGVFRAPDGFMGAETGVVRAHRLAKYLEKPYPLKMQVDHRCRNRICCEPSHLKIIGPKTHGKLSKKDQTQ